MSADDRNAYIAIAYVLAFYGGILLAWWVTR